MVVLAFGKTVVEQQDDAAPKLFAEGTDEGAGGLVRFGDEAFVGIDRIEQGLQGVVERGGAVFPGERRGAAWCMGRHGHGAWRSGRHGAVRRFVFVMLVTLPLLLLLLLLLPMSMSMSMLMPIPLPLPLPLPLTLTLTLTGRRGPAARHAAFEPAFGAAHMQAHGHRVEDFVADHDAVELVGQRVDPAHAAGERRGRARRGSGVAVRAARRTGRRWCSARQGRTTGRGSRAGRRRACRCRRRIRRSRGCRCSGGRRRRAARGCARRAASTRGRSRSRCRLRAGGRSGRRRRCSSRGPACRAPAP